MSKYESGDIVTYYFIIDKRSMAFIKAWTDKKKLAEFYLQFHNSKKFVIKEVTDTIDEIAKLLEENYHDELKIANIYTSDKKRDGKVIVIPATNTEMTLIQEECSTFFAGKIDYHYIYNAYSYLKPKYSKALERIFLSDVIDHVIHNNMNRVTSQLSLDQLKILLRSFPEEFG